MPNLGASSLPRQPGLADTMRRPSDGGLLPNGSRCIFSAAAVDAAVDRVAVRLALQLWETRPIVVCLMNGGLPFTADLLRRFHFDLELDYMHVTRYRGRVGHTGESVRFVRDLQRDVTARTVLLVDDVLDRGVTLRTAQDALATRGAKVVHTAVLVRKASSSAVATADYVALDGPDEFLVGRGMDCNGDFRQLSGIYSLPPERNAMDRPTGPQPPREDAP